MDCRISKDIDDENFIKLEETWEWRSQLDDHLCSDRFSALIGAIKLLGKSHEVRLGEGSPAEGKQAIEDARLKGVMKKE